MAIITSCIGVGGERPAQPVPAVMSPLPRRLQAQARSIAKLGRRVRGPPLLPLWNATTHLSRRLQPFLITSCHFPQSRLPSVLRGTRPIPVLDLSSTFLLRLVTYRMLLQGCWVKLVSYTPPNWSTLVHAPPSVDQISKQSYVRLCVDLVLNFRTHYTPHRGLLLLSSYRAEIISPKFD